MHTSPPEGDACHRRHTPWFHHYLARALPDALLHASAAPSKSTAVPVASTATARPSQVVNAHFCRTGVAIAADDADGFDERWRRGCRAAFERLGRLDELEAFESAGVSNGRKLQLCCMTLPPGAWFKVHAHPNIEYEVTLRGALCEWRCAARVSPADAARCDDALLPPRGAWHYGAVPAGSDLANTIGSVHQSFAGPDGATILVLWSGCHSNVRPERLDGVDERLRPGAGWA